MASWSLTLSGLIQRNIWVLAYPFAACADWLVGCSRHPVSFLLAQWLGFRFTVLCASMCVVHNTAWVQKCILIPNWRQQWIPCGRISQKSVFIHICSFYLSKVIFFKWRKRPFWIYAFRKKCWDFCEGHWGYIFFKRFKEVKSSIKTS